MTTKRRKDEGYQNCRSIKISRWTVLKSIRLLSLICEILFITHDSVGRGKRGGKDEYSPAGLEENDQESEAVHTCDFGTRQARTILKRK